MHFSLVILVYTTLLLYNMFSRQCKGFLESVHAVWSLSYKLYGDINVDASNNNNNDRLTAFDPGQPG